MDLNKEIEQLELKEENDRLSLAEKEILKARRGAGGSLEERRNYVEPTWKD